MNEKQVGRYTISAGTRYLGMNEDECFCVIDGRHYNLSEEEYDGIEDWTEGDIADFLKHQF